MKKRIVTCLLLAVMLTVAVLSAQSVTAVAFVPGDVDHDGAVTNADALAYFRYIYDAEENPLLFPILPEEEDELPIDPLDRVFG